MPLPSLQVTADYMIAETIPLIIVGQIDRVHYVGSLQYIFLIFDENRKMVTSGYGLSVTFLEQLSDI